MLYVEQSYTGGGVQLHCIADLRPLLGAAEMRELLRVGINSLGEFWNRNLTIQVVKLSVTYKHHFNFKLTLHIKKMFPLTKTL